MTEPPDTLTDLCRRMAALESRLARKRPDSNGRRMTRFDRCPYGWKPHPKNPAVLIQDPLEQQMILRIIELAQIPAMGSRAMCRHLDSLGYKRRGGKKWAGAHGLVRAILKRNNAETPAAAKLRVLERIAAARERAADWYHRPT